MTLDTFSWTQPGYVLLYGFTREQLFGYADAYCARHPQTRGKVYDSVQTYKKGIFGKYKTIVDVLVEDVPRKEQKNFQSQLMQYCQDAGLGNFIHRAPNAMSSQTKLAWTCLAAALRGEKKFLLWDYGNREDCAGTARLVNWLLSYDRSISIVWLSAGTEEALTWPLFPQGHTHISRSQGLWCVTPEGLEAADPQAVVARNEARLAEARARKEAALAAQLQQIAETEAQGHWQEALDQYMILAEQGVAEAGTRAVRICIQQCRINTDYTKWRDLADKAAQQSRSGEAYVLLGDYEMEYPEKYGDSADKDQDHKTAMVFSLSQAHKYYDMAAGCNHAEGCFKAAKLHLQYTFHSTRVTTDDEGNTTYRKRFDYTHSHAIYYIKLLLAMQAQGQDVGHYLLRLSLYDPGNYCDIARREYAEEQ